MRNRRDAALVAYRAASDAVSKSAVFAITVVAARRLSQEAFGIFALASTIGWVATVAADFGIQLHLARAIARQPAQARQFLRRWFTVRLASSGAALVAVGGTIWLTPAARPCAAAMLLLTAMYLVSGLVEFLHYFYRGLSRSDVESRITVLQRLATLVLALTALAVAPSVTLLAAALLVPAAVTLVCSVRLATRLVAETTREVFQPALLTEFAREVMPIGAGIVLSALYFRIDVFLVELWKGTSALALYNAVFRIVEALRLFPAAALAVALPVLCRATTARPLIQVSSAITLFGAVVAVVLWTTAGWLIPFMYGARYAEAVPAFRILILAFPLMSLNYALTHQLIGWNGHRAYAAICAAALFFNVVLNVRLIPSWSIVGASWSTVWTEVLLSLTCLIALKLRSERPAIESPVVMGAS